MEQFSMIFVIYLSGRLEQLNLQWGIIEGGFSNTRGDGNSVDCLAQNDWNCETIFSWKMFPISCIAI
nr:hypothetical protein CFP56_29531 [Quercus suber]